MAEIPKELFDKIRRIQYQSTRLANDLLAGAYRSAFRGKGMEFEEVREYQTGDDVRAIDWNVTARMNRPFVKSFREERDMTVTLAVDISASTQFGTGNSSKREFITEIAAVLAFSALKNSDRVGLVLFSSEVEKYYPPAKGTRHILKIIRELLAHEAEHQGTDIRKALCFLGKVHRHSSICFLISDFISPDYSHEVGIIASKHDLISISVSNPSEKELPQLGLVSLFDLETGEDKLVDTSSPALREHFKKESSLALETNRMLMLKNGADFLEVRTDQPYLPQVRKFFAIRQKRHRWGS